MLLHAEARWSCPNCTTTAVTHQPNAAKYHHCRGLRGLWVPMVADGTKAKVVALEREDYVGRELVQTDATGRPVMAVHVVTDQTQSAVIYAPTATASIT
jgi:hypothetical protein